MQVRALRRHRERALQQSLGTLRVARGEAHLREHLQRVGLLAVPLQHLPAQRARGVDPPGAALRICAREQLADLLRGLRSACLGLRHATASDSATSASPSAALSGSRCRS